MAHPTSSSNGSPLLVLLALAALALAACGRSPAPVGVLGSTGDPTGALPDNVDQDPSGSAPGGTDAPAAPPDDSRAPGGEGPQPPDAPTPAVPDPEPEPEPEPDPPPPPPKEPDLWIKHFEAKLVDGDIRYRVEVCNGGQSSALFFRVDFFYNNPTPPLPLVAGDASELVFNLEGGKCKQLTREWADAPVGVYASRVAVDTLQLVAEANEDNNAAGPKMVFVTSSVGCAAFCGFATTCGQVKWTEYTRCLDWCGLMGEDERDCARAATQKVSCKALDQCNLPPLPPPPPTMLSCYDVCQYLVNDCQLLPGDQLLTCLGGCVGLATTKQQCAYQAMQKQQCSALMLCLL